MLRCFLFDRDHREECFQCFTIKGGISCKYFTDETYTHLQWNDQ